MSNEKNIATVSAYKVIEKKQKICYTVYKNVLRSERIKIHMIKKCKKESFLEAVRFGLVGILNTFIDYGVFYCLIEWGMLDKRISQIIATIAAMCSSYLLNRFWTFSQKGRGGAGELVKFVVVNLLSMLTVILFTHLFYDILHIEKVFNTALYALGFPYQAEGNMAVMVSKLFASVFSVIVNFLGNKFWVFKDK